MLEIGAPSSPLSQGPAPPATCSQSRAAWRCPRLRAFLLPFGAPGDIPPCIRHRPFGIVDQSRVGARELIGLVQVLASTLLLCDHGAPITFHRYTAGARNHQCSDIGGATGCQGTVASASEALRRPPTCRGRQCGEGRPIFCERAAGHPRNSGQPHRVVSRDCAIIGRSRHSHGTRRQVDARAGV